MNRGLLIFDLDGTLMDTRRDLCTAVNLMRGHYGLPPLPVDIVVGYVGNGVRNLVTRSLQDFPADLDQAVRIESQFYRQHLHDETALYPGVEEGLRRLRAAGYVLALISNKPTDACLELLRHFKLADLFTSVMGGGSVRELKPHPEAVLKTMQSVRADPERTWMIGDHHTDLETARRAGVKSAFVTYGIGATGQEQAAKTFAAFEALTEYFVTIKPGHGS